jgi:hypothetical protein
MSCHTISGQSRISVTSSDIIVEADEIEMGKGSGSAPLGDVLQTAMMVAIAL